MTTPPPAAPGDEFPRRDVAMLCAGQLVSELGTRITRDGLPMVAVLWLAATPGQMGALVACASASGLAVALFAGLLVDRTRRRRLMIVADVVRFAAIASIPAAALLGRLTFAQLCAVAALAALGSTTFEIAIQAYVPSLVGVRHILKANTLLAAMQEVAEVFGSALTGWLIQALGPVAMAFDAGSYLVSAASIAAVRQREPEPARAPHGQGLRREIGEGFRLLARDPVLRALAGSSAASRFAGGFLEMGYSLYVLRSLRLSPASLGVFIGAGGAGGVVGALVSGAVIGRLGVGKSVVAMSALSSAIFFVLLLPGGPSAFAFGALLSSQLVGDFGQSITRIGQVSIVQARSPERARGRINAAMNVAVGLAGPFGALAGGVLGDELGMRATMLAAGGLRVAATAWLALSPIRKSASLTDFEPPAEPADPSGPPPEPAAGP